LEGGFDTWKERRYPVESAEVERVERPDERLES